MKIFTARCPMVAGVLTFAFIATGCQQYDNRSDEALMIASENQRSIEQLGKRIDELANRSGTAQSGAPHNPDLVRLENDLVRSVDAAIAKHMSGVREELSRANERIAELETALGQYAAADVSACEAMTSSDIFPDALGSSELGLGDLMHGHLRNRIKEQLEAMGLDTSDLPEDMEGLFAKKLELDKLKRAKEIGLDEATTARLGDIENAYRNKAMELTKLRHEGNITEDQYKIERDTAKSTAEQELNTVLTPDQKKKYDEQGGLTGNNRKTIFLGGQGGDAMILEVSDDDDSSELELEVIVPEPSDE